MTLDTQHVEFGYELISSVPYAYWLHQNGQLDEVITSQGAEALYYFANKVTIRNRKREWRNTKFTHNLPNYYIHNAYLDLSRFSTPDYKGHYANEDFKFKKPTLCICNRYNIEWGKRPVNWFDLDLLDEIFTALRDKYQIVYFGVDLPDDFQDQQESMKLGDRQMIKRKYKDVIIFQDLLKDGRDWNKTMMQIFANCEKYITMNGGYSILAAYFGGQNIIYSKPGVPQCKEILPTINSFWHWYPEFGNQQTCHVASYNELKEKINNWYVDELPTVNVLIRTHRRENYFRNCYQSIAIQNYKNINIVVGIQDNDDITRNYVKDYKCRVVNYQKPTKLHDKLDRVAYGVEFPYNEYLNVMSRIVNGWILVLDDDNVLSHPDSISKMVNAVTSADDVLYFRVGFPAGRIVPSDKNFGAEPVCRDIDSAGFMYHSKYAEQVDWGHYKRGDYRVALKLYELTQTQKYLNFVLTKLQDLPGNGKKGDLQKNENNMSKKFVDVEVIKDRYKNHKFFSVGHVIKQMPISNANELQKKGLIRIIGEKIEPVIIKKAELSPIEKVAPVVDVKKEVSPEPKKAVITEELLEEMTKKELISKYKIDKKDARLSKANLIKHILENAV